MTKSYFHHCSTVPIATKLGRMITYLMRSCLESHMTLWSRDQAKSRGIISHLHPCYSTLWSRGLARSRDRLRPLYHRCRNVCGLKARQDGDLPWLLFTNKVSCPCNYFEVWDYMTNVLSPLPQCLWLQNVAEWWITLSHINI